MGPLCKELVSTVSFNTFTSLRFFRTYSAPLSPIVCSILRLAAIALLIVWLDLPPTLAFALSRIESLFTTMWFLAILVPGLFGY